MVLKDRAGRGRLSRNSPSVQMELKQILLDGPDPNIDEVTRWRIIYLQAWLKREHAIECSETTVRRMVHKLGFVKMTARPQHRKQAPEVIEAFKKTL